MKTKILFFAILLAAAVALGAWWAGGVVHGGVAKGRSDAEADIKAGKLAIEVLGMPGPSDGIYERLLREDYHVELRQVGGCVAEERVFDHAEGYDAVMKAEIMRRFGADVIERTKEKAMQLTAPLEAPEQPR